MVDRLSARRSPARYLVPLALAATALSTYLVVEHALHTTTRRSAGSNHRVARHRRTSPHSSHVVTPTGPATYVIQSGDTLGTIAQRFGVSVAEIELLNPNLNPNALQVGLRLRLRR
jgi:LysM repeat protein